MLEIMKAHLSDLINLILKTLRLTMDPQQLKQHPHTDEAVFSVLLEMQDSNLLADE
jgi:hypothetical protein